ncbi:hypothetical protein [Isoptericola sp. NPDC056573]|uniref:hypothetical protein n=1 Tax=unclassified Isoptericola TaxID=2623355 RepID=UPI00369101A1
MTDDLAPRPAEAAALLEQAERTTLVGRVDRVVWTWVAVAVGALWGGFSLARWLLPGRTTEPVQYLVPLAVFVGFVVLLWRVADLRSRATPHIGWMTRMWPAPLPLLMYVPTDLVVHHAGLDPIRPVVVGLCAFLVALPCLAAAHRIWWDSWVPGRGTR